MMLTQKKISQEQYDITVTALKTQHASNLLLIEKSYYDKSQSLGFKDAGKATLL